MWKGSRMISLPSKSSRGNNWQPMYGGGSEEKTPSSEHPDSQTARLAACWVGLLLYFFSFSYSIFLLYELFTKNYLPRWFGRKGFFFLSVFLATRWPGAFWSQFPFVLLCDFSIHRAAAYWVSKNTDGHSMYTRIAEGSRESLRAPPPPFFPYLLLLFSFRFGSVRQSVWLLKGSFLLSQYCPLAPLLRKRRKTPPIRWREDWVFWPPRMESNSFILFILSCNYGTATIIWPHAFTIAGCTFTRNCTMDLRQHAVRRTQCKLKHAQTRREEEK